MILFCASPRKCIELKYFSFHQKSCNFNGLGNSSLITMLMYRHHFLLLLCILYQLPPSSAQSFDSLTDALYTQANGLMQQSEDESAIQQLDEALQLIQHESLTRQQIIRFYEKAIHSAEAIFQKTKNDKYLEQAFAWTEQCKALLINHLREKINLVKSNIKIIQLDELRDKVVKDSVAFLEYLIGEESIFLFKITNNTIQLEKIKRDITLEKKIKQFMRLVSTPSNDASKFAELAYQLYTYLLPVSLPQKCVITPDGILHYLPFEVLVTQQVPKPDFKTLPYLLRKTSISYTYSATELASHYKGLPINIGKQFLGIAYPDPDSRDEVAQLNRKLDGDVLITSENALSDVQQNMDDYDIIHLAMNGIISDTDIRQSGIYLIDNQHLIDVKSLYQQDMDASMVVLNSCNTDIDKINTGEGITAMTQALSKDSESVITAHWTTDKTASKDIMKRFYRHLSNKAPKGDALRQAKLDYLSENYVNSKTAHPYYWASCMAYNNMLPLEIQILIEDFMWIAAVLILALLAIGYIMLRKKTKVIPVGPVGTVLTANGGR